MRKHRFTHTAALALTALAVAAPTAGATTDYRNPDQRSVSPSATQDFRSADARDSRPVESSTPQIAQDYRSADTRDVAAGRGIPEVTVVKVAQPASPSSGLDWGDAGIGAGFLLGLILLGLGTMQVVLHRKHRQPAITQ